jgi:hypothetical protein
VQQEERPQTAPAMRRVNVNFLQVHGIRLDPLDVRQADRGLVSENDPEMAISLSLGEGFWTGRFGER